MTYYVQLDRENKITDVITYPYSNYIQVELESPLPVGIMNGTYQLVNNELVYRQDWESQMIDAQAFTDLQSQVDEMRILLDSLLNKNSGY